MNYIGQLMGMAAIAVSFFIYIKTKRYRMVMMKLTTDLHNTLFFNTDRDK